MLPRWDITCRYLFSRIQTKAFHGITLIWILCLCSWHAGSTTYCHPLPPETMKGHDTCGAGTTWVGAWCVVALHKGILWTRMIRKAAFIYISTADRAARRGHPASVTDTAVLGLPQQISHYIFKTVRTVKKRAGGVHCIKRLLNYGKKDFRALHGLHILFHKLLW